MTPAFRFLRYFLTAMAVVAQAIVAISTSRSSNVPNLNIVKFSIVFVVTKSPDIIIIEIQAKSNFVSLSLLRIKNPIIIMKIGCICPINTALITGICVKAKKYKRSAKSVPTIAIYANVENCCLFILSLASLANPIYIKAVNVTKIALTAEV